MIPPRFGDRREAGQALAEALRPHAGRPDLMVVGLLRGGVPVAYEVAEALGSPLDVFVVRKLPFPGEEEWALGAIATGGVRVVNEEAFERLGGDRAALDRIAGAEGRELERRERVYRGGRPPPDLRDRLAIVVDDGLHTGASMRAAVRALRQHGPARVVVGAPVEALAACDALQAEADEVVCVITPEPLLSVGVWYRDFSEIGDDEVRRLLAAGLGDRPRTPPAEAGVVQLSERQSDHVAVVREVAPAGVGPLGGPAAGAERAPAACPSWAWA